jgi:hypothetical protein
MVRLAAKGTRQARQELTDVSVTSQRIDNFRESV